MKSSCAIPILKVSGRKQGLLQQSSKKVAASTEQVVEAPQASADSNAVKTSLKEKPDMPVLGSRRIRKVWTALNELMHSTADYTTWLSVLFDLMTTPQYAQVKYTKFSSKTGKPLEFSWVPDPSSMPRSFSYYPRTDTKLPKELRMELDALLKDLEKSKLPVLYTTPRKDSVDIAKIRRIVVYRDYIQTGVGHNDSPSYTYALVFYPIVAEEEVLIGY